MDRPYNEYRRDVENPPGKISKNKYGILSWRHTEYNFTQLKGVNTPFNCLEV